VTAVADSFGEMGSLNADAKGRTRTRSFITEADKLTLRGEFWSGSGLYRRLDHRKRVRRSRMHIFANHGGCVSGREGPETNEGDRNLNFEIEM
jgi:hypothetical protein